MSIKTIQSLVDHAIEVSNTIKDLGLDVKHHPIPKKTKKIALKLKEDDYGGGGYGLYLVKNTNGSGWIAIPVHYSNNYDDDFYYLLEEVEVLNSEKAIILQSTARHLVDAAIDFDFIYNDSYAFTPTI